jgi:hypothetical protein
MVTSDQPIWGSFVAGNLYAGSVFAGFVALGLALPTLLFSLMFVGLPGFTPWFTMVVYLNAARFCWRVGRRLDNRGARFLLAGLGCFVSALVGLVAHLLWSAVA